MIAVEGLKKYYGPHPALADVSFHVDRGGVAGFLGANGAGKTTLLRILATFLAPTSGTARVCGYDVRKEPMEVRRRIGYLPENTPLYPELRVSEFLDYRARLKELPREARRGSIGRVIDRCGLQAVSRRVIGQLSKGFRQRVALAECLLAEAPLLILDEPTVGLDPHQARETRDLIAEIGRDRTVFLSTHLLQDAELMCRQVIIIDAGRLLAVDSPASLCARSGRARALLVEAVGREDIGRALGGLPGVRGVQTLGRTPEGGERFRLEVEETSRARLAVLKLFEGNDWQLKELRLEPVRLEDIFAELTRRGPGRAAPSASGGRAAS
ncbi:MAG: ABC transporter ATP-binding protein [Planctomycetota bacterium]